MKKKNTNRLPLAIYKKSPALPVYEAAQSGNSSSTSGFYPGSGGSTLRYLETWRADSSSSSHAPGPTQGPGLRPSSLLLLIALKTVFRIRLHLIRIRNQPLRLIIDPDPWVWWPKIEKNVQQNKKFNIFLIKNCNLPIPRPPQRRSKLQRKPSAFKRKHPALQNMKFLIFSYYCGSYIALLDQDSESGSGSTDLIESDSNPDPDPKHSLKQLTK